jgi:hypothetical protein
MCAALSIWGSCEEMAMLAIAQNTHCLATLRATRSCRQRAERRTEKMNAPRMPKTAPLAPTDGPPVTIMLAIEATMPVMK